ncbi:hypothetical protein CBR_g21204 [Chara braunii]|uniref:Uncharacterized protein n=1 Tax=Chara braunii TaxID=69332 RepID=A0A388L151_CHABU|nr:hypothetical protein CBR_g21204 [Chara braunii]|eukprot:GBG75962.1 hypothetical protein CBR_g21204 [Chara braunii]
MEASQQPTGALRGGVQGTIPIPLDPLGDRVMEEVEQAGAKEVERDNAAPEDERRRSPPPAFTDYSRDEPRIRHMMEMCYDMGVMPPDIDVGEMREDGCKVTFILNSTIDEIKLRWLKERSVTVIFQDGSKNLPKRVKEEVIRAYEDTWVRERLFDSAISRGRVKMESANVLTYIAKDARVATWKKEKEIDKILLRRKWHTIAFKPWLTKTELEEERRQEQQKYFWIPCIDVPVDAYCYLHSAASRSIGEVHRVYPPERDSQKPQLINVRLDIVAEARENIKDSLSFVTCQQQEITVAVATALTPWCDTCRIFFHLPATCPRNRSRPRQQRSGSNDRQSERRERSPSMEDRRSRERRRSPSPAPSEDSVSSSESRGPSVIGGGGGAGGRPNADAESPDIWNRRMDGDRRQSRSGTEDGARNGRPGEDRGGNGRRSREVTKGENSQNQ